MYFKQIKLQKKTNLRSITRRSYLSGKVTFTKPALRYVYLHLLTQKNKNYQLNDVNSQIFVEEHQRNLKKSFEIERPIGKSKQLKWIPIGNCLSYEFKKRKNLLMHDIISW